MTTPAIPGDQLPPGVQPKTKKAGVVCEWHTGSEHWRIFREFVRGADHTLMLAAPGPLDPAADSVYAAALASDNEIPS